MKTTEAATRAATRHGHGRRGSKRTPTYTSWDGMIQRTTNPASHVWSYYGGRGITVCERWRDFANFLEDMGERPVALTLDRINVNGNYEPGNCRWATRSQQTQNRRPQALCKWGHELVGRNIKGKARRCRICANQKNHEWRERQKSS